MVWRTLLALSVSCAFVCGFLATERNCVRRDGDDDDDDDGKQMTRARTEKKNKFEGRKNLLPAAFFR